MCSSAPNTQVAQEAALKQAQTSQEALDWYKQIYAEGAGDRATATETAQKTAEAQLGLSQQALTQQQQDRQRYLSEFQPIEDKIVADAQGYDTPQRREDAARQAMADTQIALNNARESSARAMERRGVMPGSGASLALSGSMDLGAAKALAGAANTARQRVETVGAAKMADAAALGRGVITDQATQAQIGLSSGNSAVGNANMPNTIRAQGTSIMGQGYNTAIQGNNSAANISLGVANAQAGTDAANAQTAGAAGSAIGGIAMAIAI